MSREVIRSRLSLLALCAFAATGCTRPATPALPTDMPAAATIRQDLLKAAGQCVLGHAETFAAKARQLETETAALSAAGDAGTPATARLAFAEALDAWQIQEAMHVGPAAASENPGGQDLRDQIYSWPLVSRCAVEEELVARNHVTAGTASLVVNRRGLAALEYLLNYEGSDTACPPTSPIVSSSSWAALSPEELRRRRYTYAAAVAADVRANAEKLTLALKADGGNFVGELETAGAGSAVFPSARLALNAVSDAMFYVEGTVKDQKLARPLGLRDCAEATCPQLLESPFSLRSKRNLQQNLAGLRMFLVGCGADNAGVAFDDLLVSVGAQDLKDRLLARLDGIDATLLAIPGDDLGPALAGNPAAVRASYDAIKALTDLIKTEFATTLDLELPQSLEGDND